VRATGMEVGRVATLDACVPATVVVRGAFATFGLAGVPKKVAWPLALRCHTARLFESRWMDCRS
jgi:hypothetical protein